MRKVYIPKGKGQFRLIYVPDASERAKIRYRMGKLRRVHKDNCSKHVHGFFPGRSPVTNARQHIGRQFTLSFDLKDFFESVTVDKFRRATWWSIPNSIINILFPDGAARQGLPSSPIIANITAAKMDAEIIRCIRGVTLPKARRVFGDQPANRNVVYTRYADDLTFSFDSVRWVEVLQSIIPKIVKECGFEINPAKTKLQCAAAGNRIITGVSVGKTGITTPRYIKRNRRAALNQGNTESAEGLEEWMNLKLPKEYVQESCEIQHPQDQGETPAAKRARKAAPMQGKIVNVRGRKIDLSDS